VLAGFGFEENLINLEIAGVRQQGAQHLLLARLEEKFAADAVGCDGNLRLDSDAGSDLVDLGHGKQLARLRLLVQGGNELRVKYIDLAHLPLQKKSLGEFGDR